MEFLENHLLGFKNILIYYSEYIGIKNILSSILKNLAEKIDKDHFSALIKWSNFEIAQVIFAEDEQQNILGGICFFIDEEINSCEILLVFKNSNEYDTLHSICIENLKKIVKKQGVSILLQTVHSENIVEKELANLAGLKEKYYVISSSIF